MSEYQRRASRLGLAHPLLEAERQSGNSQSRKARGKLGPRDGILYQTMSRLPVANQVFLETWIVGIRKEGHSQTSVPQRTHMPHLRWRSCCAIKETERLGRGRW